mmetsp:Transcript_31577/g.77852  ORF Transcript_31577/g.77852 Transcript_31577/m.77852 type:complete len:118 (+) Transcript_31577:478-831(+)
MRPRCTAHGDECDQHSELYTQVQCTDAACGWTVSVRATLSCTVHGMYDERLQRVDMAHGRDEQGTRSLLAMAVMCLLRTAGWGGQEPPRYTFPVRVPVIAATRTPWRPLRDTHDPMA